MTIFTLTVEQIKDIFEAGKSSSEESFPYESLALIMQNYLNEGVSVHSKQYLHMTDVMEILQI